MKNKTGKKTFKTSLWIFIILVFVLVAVAAFASTAYAAVSELNFTLTSNGKSEITVHKGDVFTVQFSVSSSKGSVSAAAIQNEISYDKTLFEFVDGSEESILNGTVVNPVTLFMGDTQVNVNNINTNTFGASGTKVASFKLKVIAGTGSAYIRNTEVGAADGMGNMSPVNENHLKVKIVKQSDGGDNGGGAGGSEAPSDAAAQEPETTAPEENAAGSTEYSFSYKSCDKSGNCAVAQFSDITSDAWSHDGVHFCVENGIMNGTAAGVFSPAASTTRGMVVTILWRMAGSPDVSYIGNFTDVSAGDWYAKAVAWASANGIVSGSDNGSFMGNGQITREQFAKMFCEYAKYKNIVLNTESDSELAGYADGASVSSWAQEYMRWACATGLIGGISRDDGMHLDPAGSATREQSATMIMRFCEKINSLNN